MTTQCERPAGRGLSALLAGDWRVTAAFSKLRAVYGNGRGWLAGDWPSTGGVLNIIAAAWTAGFHWWRSGNITRMQNVSEYMLVLALCLVQPVNIAVASMKHSADVKPILHGSSSGHETFWVFIYTTFIAF